MSSVVEKRAEVTGFRYISEDNGILMERVLSEFIIYELVYVELVGRLVPNSCPDSSACPIKGQKNERTL